MVNPSIGSFTVSCQPNVEKLSSTELTNELEYLAEDFISPPDSSKPESIGILWMVIKIVLR